MTGKLFTTPDRNIVKTTLITTRISADYEELIIDHLNKLLNVLQVISADQETKEAQNFAGTAPSTRRKQLKSAARKLEEIADMLEVLRAPMLRYRKDGTIPPTWPTGLIEFKQGIANELTSVLSVPYISTFGIVPILWDRTDASLGPINTRNIAFAIEASAEDIIIDLLKRLSLGLQGSEKAIAENTPAGGPRNSRIRDILLINLVALWDQIHQQKARITYSGGQTKFFDFCKEMSRSIGAGSLCTETHVAAAVKAYQAKTLPETPPKDDPSLSNSDDR